MQAAGRDRALPKVYPIQRRASFHEDVDQNGSGQHVELAPARVNTFVSVDTVLSEEKDTREDLGSKRNMKKSVRKNEEIENRKGGLQKGFTKIYQDRHAQYSKQVAT